MHLRVFEVRYLDMINRCLAEGSEFGIVPLLEGREVRTPEGQEVLAAAGTMARLLESTAPMPGLLQIVCQGTQRFRLVSATQGRYGLWTGEIETLPEDAACEIPAALQPAADALGAMIADLQRRGTPAAVLPIAPPFRLDECGWVADRWTELLPLSMGNKQDLLLTLDPERRLQVVHSALQEHGLLR